MKSKQIDRQTAPKQRNSRSEAKPTTTQEELDRRAQEQIQALEHLERLMDQLPRDPGQTAAVVDAPSYTMSAADAVSVTASEKANSGQLMRWLFDTTFPVIFAQKPKQEAIATLEALRTILLNSGPKSPIEVLLVTQSMASFRMAMLFCERSISSGGIEAQSRFANQAARFMELSSRQAEAITKLRGGHQQRVVVQHVHDGGQVAVIGATNAPGGGGGAQK